MTTTAPDVLVLTHGHHHDLPDGLPKADLQLDLRRLLDDPAHRPEGDMLGLTGLDPVVRDFVFATRGARTLIRRAVRLVRGAAAVKPVVVLVGCAGGKHRAAAVGQELADRLGRRGWRFWIRPLHVEVRHLHVDLPRVVRPDELVAH